MPTRRDEQILAIFDGGVASLAALLLAERPQRAIAWIPPMGTRALDHTSSAINDASVQATNRLVELLGMKGVEKASTVWCGSPATPDHVLLWQACIDARRLGCETVLWPIVAGHDHEAMIAADETALLAARLAWLDRSTSVARDACPEVRTPLADLTFEQVMELARDLDAPLAEAWNTRLERKTLTHGSPVDLAAREH